MWGKGSNSGEMCMLGKQIVDKVWSNSRQGVG